MIKTFHKLFIGLGLVVSVIGGQMMLPVLASAQTAATTTGDPCVKLEEQMKNAGYKDTLPKYCTTGSLYNKIISGALYAVGIVGVIAIIYGGYLYMTSGANEEQRKRGRSVLTWAVLGLVVVILATLLVNVVVNLFTT